MKKIMYVLGLSLMASSLYAACYGPFCFDDTGASINGYSLTGAGFGVPDASSSTIAALIPLKKGQLVWCNSCIGANASKGVYCTSTATVVGSFILMSSATAVTACQ